MGSEYETRLSKKQEARFWPWLEKQHSKGYIADGDYRYYKQNGGGYDYDFRAAYANGEKPSLNKADGRYHWSDIGKKPNHSTFSTESKYATVPGVSPGRWEGDTFVPPGNTNPDRVNLNPDTPPSNGEWPSTTPALGWKPPSITDTPMIHNGQPVTMPTVQDQHLFQLIKGANDKLAQ